MGRTSPASKLTEEMRRAFLSEWEGRQEAGEDDTVGSHCLFPVVLGAFWLSGDYNLKDWRIEISRYSECCAPLPHAGRPHLSTVLCCLNPLPVLSLPSFINSVPTFKGLLDGRPSTEDITVHRTRFSFSGGAHSLLASRPRNREIGDGQTEYCSTLPSPGEPICLQPLWMGHSPSVGLPPATPPCHSLAFPSKEHGE